MKVSEIVKNATKPEEIITALKVRPANMPAPNKNEINSKLDVEKHLIYDPVLRKDRTTYPNPVKDKAGNITGKGEPKTEFVNRIGLALQGLIIKRAVAFLFGNPVIKNYRNKTDDDDALISFLEEVEDNNKEEMLNRQAARSVFSHKEVAEYWFTVDAEQEHDEYGFKTKRKLKCVTYSPENGDNLFPFFDNKNDLVAFSREFTVKLAENVSTTFFETYTKSEIRRWKRSSINNTWEELPVEPVVIGKIPIVYGYQKHHETREVDNIIERLETLFSNLADTNDYHSAPKIFVNGKIVSFGSKGESNTVIQGEKDAKAQYLSWDHAPESFKVEVENLIRMLFTITQTPDISFDNVKGLSLSGIALKLMFMDAHLKVKDKEEIFIPYLQRRYSIQKAYAGEMNNSFKTSRLKIKPQIDPFMIADDLVQAQILQAANGGKPFISQEKSVTEWGGDREDYDKILLEAKEANSLNVFEPTI